MVNAPFRECVVFSLPFPPFPLFCWHKSGVMLTGGLVGDSGRTVRSLSAASKPRITQRTTRHTPSIQVEGAEHIFPFFPLFFFFFFPSFFLFCFSFFFFSFLFCERTQYKTYWRHIPQTVYATHHNTPRRSTTQHSTSWRSATDTILPGHREHTGGSRQDTHGTPVLTTVRRPWVAQPHEHARADARDTQCEHQRC